MLPDCCAMKHENIKALYLLPNTHIHTKVRQCTHIHYTALTPTNQHTIQARLLPWT